METVNLEIKLEHNKPVDLIDMANSLISLSHLAIDRIDAEHGIKDTKIMLAGVKEGSDIYQLALTFGAGVLPFVEGVNSISAFSDYVTKLLNLDDKNIKEIEQVESIVKPVLGDESSRYSIDIKDSNNTNINIVQINHDQAHKIMKNSDLVKKIKNEYETKEDNTHYEKVLISMYATTNSKKKVKDKAYCDDVVLKKAIATVIEDEKAKKVILDDPYTNYFLVDLEVNRVGGEAKLYRVTKLHEVIPKED